MASTSKVSETFVQQGGEQDGLLIKIRLTALMAFKRRAEHVIDNINKDAEVPIWIGPSLACRTSVVYEGPLECRAFCH